MRRVRNIPTIIGHGFDVLELLVELVMILSGFVSFPLELNSDGGLEASPLLASPEAPPNLLHVGGHPTKRLLSFFLKLEELCHKEDI
jgi:hypothetical protein